MTILKSIAYNTKETTTRQNFAYNVYHSVDGQRGSIACTSTASTYKQAHNEAIEKALSIGLDLNDLSFELVRLSDTVIKKLVRFIFKIK